MVDNVYQCWQCDRSDIAMVWAPDYLAEAYVFIGKLVLGSPAQHLLNTKTGILKMFFDPCNAVHRSENKNSIRINRKSA